MSNRWYPLYQRGNPQLRVFLPNFFMKMIKPKHAQPPNVVTFAVSMEMTRVDVQNYMEKIYKIPVIAVRTEVTPGELKKSKVKGSIIKEDDYKTAFVELDKSVKFTFPEIFTGAKDKKHEKDLKGLDEIKKSHRKQVERNVYRPGVPGWFSL